MDRPLRVNGAYSGKADRIAGGNVRPLWVECPVAIDGGGSGEALGGGLFGSETGLCAALAVAIDRGGSGEALGGGLFGN